jgi:hypothetical protein
MGFELAYSKLARHISAARCWQEGLDDTSLSARQKSILREIHEAYEFIQLFEQMMTTVQVETSDPVVATDQLLATEDLRRIFPRPVPISEKTEKPALAVGQKWKTKSGHEVNIASTECDDNGSIFFFVRENAFAYSSDGKAYFGNTNEVPNHAMAHELVELINQSVEEKKQSTLEK